MKPVGKTTLYRMQLAAQAEADRLEMIDRPPAYVIDKRDAFAGIVRLISIILSDQVLIERIKDRMTAQTVLATDTETAEVAEQ
jgi:hypothetical protein